MRRNKNGHIQVIFKKKKNDNNLQKKIKVVFRFNNWSCYVVVIVTYIKNTHHLNLIMLNNKLFNVKINVFLLITM